MPLSQKWLDPFLRFIFIVAKSVFFEKSNTKQCLSTERHPCRRGSWCLLSHTVGLLHWGNTSLKWNNNRAGKVPARRYMASYYSVAARLAPAHGLHIVWTPNMESWCYRRLCNKLWYHLPLPFASSSTSSIINKGLEFNLLILTRFPLRTLLLNLTLIFAWSN